MTKTQPIKATDLPPLYLDGVICGAPIVVMLCVAVALIWF